MMCQSLLWFLLSVPLAAQTPYFNLSGEWTLTEPGKPPRPIRIPFAKSTQPVGRYTIERTVDLPPALDSSRLALLIPAMHGSHRVRVNGTEVGGYGDMQTANTPALRPRAYSLRSVARASHLRVAIEISRPQALPIAIQRVAGSPDSLVLAGEQTIRGELAGRESIDGVSQLFDGLVAAASLLVTMVILLLSRNSQDAVATRWLALSIFCAALTEGVAFTSRVAYWPGALAYTSVFILAGPLVQLTFVEFMFRYARFVPRMRVPLYALYFFLREANYFAGSNSAGSNNFAIVLLMGLELWCLIASWRSPIPFVRFVPIALLALAALTFFPTGRVAHIRLRPASALRIFIYAGLTAVLVRRAGMDRSERERLAAELESARTMQQLLFPASETGAVDAVYLPAAEVGGDFWQALPAADGKSRIVAVGDVSGKGLRAAMVVSLLTGALRNRKSDEPAAILGDLNRVAASALRGGFVTAAVARVDGDHITIANAGHLAPYLAGVELEVEAGLPLGIDPDASYTEKELLLTGALTFVSDGVIEAKNAKGELFGFERTAAISIRSASEIAEAARAWGQNDDITVVTIRGNS